MDLYPYFEITQAPEKRMGSGTEKINKLDATVSRDSIVEPDRHKTGNRDSRREKENDEAWSHFETIRCAAEAINSELERKKSPYRFYVYQENDQVFISLVRLDAAGDVAEVKQKDITHQEFNDLICQIEETGGLLFDVKG